MGVNDAIVQEVLYKDTVVQEVLYMYYLARNIKESIYIRVNNPSLNNNIGKFNLSHRV